jgi:disulfide oxidoreductase YuzD
MARKNIKEPKGLTAKDYEKWLDSAEGKAYITQEVSKDLVEIFNMPESHYENEWGYNPTLPTKRKNQKKKK